MYVATDIHNCERHRPERFRSDEDLFYRSEEYLKARAVFEKNIKNGMPIDTVGPRLFKAIEDNQMYIITHPVTIPYIEERHRNIEIDAKKELEFQ